MAAAAPTAPTVGGLRQDGFGIGGLRKSVVVGRHQNHDQNGGGLLHGNLDGGFCSSTQLSGPLEAEMRLYRRELGADTPAMLKANALELMTKEFSARAAAAELAESSMHAVVPRVATDADPTVAWEHRPSALGRKSRPPSEDDLLLGHVHVDSFRSAMSLAVAIGQCFSVLPAYTRPGTEPRFCFWSWRVFYSCLITFGLFCNAVLTIVDVIRVPRDENSITASSRWMFYVCSTVVSLLYFKLGVQWRQLCLCFLRVEHRMSDLGHPPNMRCRLRTVTIAVLSLALVEYLLAIFSGILSMNLDQYDSFHRFWTDYYVGYYPQMNFVVPYNPVIVALEQTVNTAGTFMWNYNDLFITLVSIAIAQWFKFLNTKLHQCPRQDKTPQFWKDAREKYNALSVLTREVDRLLCVQVLFSFMNNLYFICIQLLHTVKHEDNTLLKNVYFLFSFGLLILRTVFLSLSAASINDESKNVRKVLYSVSSSSYCEEVDRFIIQATTDEIALTGLKFFSVTRSFLLTVAGTIATYEIVLVQFNGNKKTT